MLTYFDPAVLFGLKLALIAILCDTAIGWLLAFVSGEFDIRMVPQFLKTNVLPYFGALVVLALVTVADAAYAPLFYFICLIVTTKFGIEALKDKLTQFFKPANEPPDGITKYN